MTADDCRDVSQHFVRNLLAEVADGNVWLPTAAWYLQEAGLANDPRVTAPAFINALDYAANAEEWQARADQYADPDYDDGSVPVTNLLHADARREWNRLQHEEALRQVAAAKARLDEAVAVLVRPAVKGCAA